MKAGVLEGKALYKRKKCVQKLYFNSTAAHHIANSVTVLSFSLGLALIFGIPAKRYSAIYSYLANLVPQL